MAAAAGAEDRSADVTFDSAACRSRHRSGARGGRRALLRDCVPTDGERFEGYIDLQLLKLQAALVGTAPAGINYRFSITFTSEALRQKWVASDAHQDVWGTLETFLTKREYDFLLFDVI